MEIIYVDGEARIKHNGEMFSYEEARNYFENNGHCDERVSFIVHFSRWKEAKEIADILKDWIKKGKFLLAEPVANLPGHDSGYTSKPLKEKPIK